MPRSPAQCARHVGAGRRRRCPPGRDITGARLSKNMQERTGPAPRRSPLPRPPPLARVAPPSAAFALNSPTPLRTRRSPDQCVATTSERAGALPGPRRRGPVGPRPQGDLLQERRRDHRNAEPCVGEDGGATAPPGTRIPAPPRAAPGRCWRPARPPRLPAGPRRPALPAGPWRGGLRRAAPSKAPRASTPRPSPAAPSPAKPRRTPQRGGCGPQGLWRASRGSGARPRLFREGLVASGSPTADAPAKRGIATQGV